MNLGIINFNGGLFSPKIDCRSDTERYASGCRILQNMIPTIYGGVERRTGSEYITIAIGASTILSYILSYANVAVCYENETVVTKVDVLNPPFICYENDVICYENTPVTDGQSVFFVNWIYCYENNIVFYENEMVIRS